MPGKVYVLARLFGDDARFGITGAEFRITGFPALWFPVLTPNPAATVTGDPLGDGCSVSFADCQTGGVNFSVLLYSVTFLPTDAAVYPVHVETLRYGYRVPRQAYELASRLLPVAAPGTADRKVQAYNYRMCLSDVAENRVAFEKPPGYDPRRFADEGYERHQGDARQEEGSQSEQDGHHSPNHNSPPVLSANGHDRTPSYSFLWTINL